jgi:Na+-transporting methylmalonyl-CoA/oxaloacetate decarboxylase gamma subunit
METLTVYGVAVVVLAFTNLLLVILLMGFIGRASRWSKQAEYLTAAKESLERMLNANQIKRHQLTRLVRALSLEHGISAPIADDDEDEDDE